MQRIFKKSELEQILKSSDFEGYKAKARIFLRDNQNHITIRKIRMNESLTRFDLAELEKMLKESGVFPGLFIDLAISNSQGLGLFVRNLVGLDRATAKQAFAVFLESNTATANQIEFVSVVIDHLVEHGTIEATKLYESPFTDLTPQGPVGLFNTQQVSQLIAILLGLRAGAIAP